MTTDKKDNADAKVGNTGAGADDALQQELEREQKEPKDAIGDLAADTNLSGSSTWTTLPPDDKAKPDAKK